MTPHVYLLGPIANVSYKKATDWRKQVTALLAPDIITLDPMRGYTETHTPAYQHKDVVTRDLADIRRAELVLAYWCEPVLSVGSLIEMGVALALNKPVYFVDPDYNTQDNDEGAHPFVKAVVTQFFADVYEAADATRLFLNV